MTWGWPQLDKAGPGLGLALWEVSIMKDVCFYGNRTRTEGQGGQNTLPGGQKSIGVVKQMTRWPKHIAWRPEMYRSGKTNESFRIENQ